MIQVAKNQYIRAFRNRKSKIVNQDVFGKLQIWS